MSILKVFFLSYRRENRAGSALICVAGRPLRMTQFEDFRLIGSPFSAVWIRFCELSALAAPRRAPPHAPLERLQSKSAAQTDNHNCDVAGPVAHRDRNARGEARGRVERCAGVARHRRRARLGRTRTTVAASLPKYFRPQRASTVICSLGSLALAQEPWQQSPLVPAVRLCCAMLWLTQFFCRIGCAGRRAPGRARRGWHIPSRPAPPLRGILRTLAVDSVCRGFSPARSLCAPEHGHTSSPRAPARHRRLRSSRVR